MNRARVVRWSLVGLFVAFLAAQFVPVVRTNPAVESEVPASAEVRAVLRRACYDCHSNETVWPWYSKVAPASWLVADDVEHGRRHVNFSTWNRLTPEDQAKAFREIWDEVEAGEMPLWQYRPLHPAARLSDADKVYPAGLDPEHGRPLTRSRMLPPSVSIRPAAATDADAATLTVLRGALFREMGQHPSAERQREFADFSATTFKKGLASGSCFAWLAETEAHRAVGSVALLIFPRLPSPVLLAPQEGYLLNVYTEPEWRGQGIATALVAVAITRAKELGLARIRLHATASGQTVYAAAGFRVRTDEMELRLD